jgi:hypothetical protein
VVSDMIDNGQLPLLQALKTAGYNHNTQIYLWGPNSKFIVADNLFSADFDPISRTWKGAINDSKLTSAAGWTDNQDEILRLFGTQSEITFEIRTNKGALRPGQKITIKKSDMYKTSYTGTDDVRQLIDTNQFGTIKTKTVTEKVFK